MLSAAAGAIQRESDKIITGLQANRESTSILIAGREPTLRKLRACLVPGGRAGDALFLCEFLVKEFIPLGNIPACHQKYFLIVSYYTVGTQNFHFSDRARRVLSESISIGAAVRKLFLNYFFSFAGTTIPN